MGELEDIVNKVANDTTEIIVNPATFDKMVEQDLPISFAEPIPFEDYVEKLFSSRKKDALMIIKNLPPRYSFLLPAVNALYDEIIECILFGLNGAAITLCGILVEFALKQTTYFYENGCKFTYDSSLWDEFENLTLGPTITRARTANIIDDDLENKMKRFKDTVRNPYNHYNIKKITKDVVARNVKVVNTKTLKVETRDIEAKDNPMIHAQAKRHVDKIAVYPVFAFSDRVVKSLLNCLKEKNNK